MRSIFVNRYFHPDHSATSQILSDLAFFLAAEGREVHVITGRQVYDDPKAKLPTRERVLGVEIHRAWSTRFGRATLIGRAADYATFYISAAWLLLRQSKAGDVVVAKTDPPLISVVAAGVTRWTGATLVSWIQDLFPETAETMAINLFSDPVGRGLRRLRNYADRTAEMTVVPGGLIADRLAQTGVPRERIAVISNWADDVAISPLDHADNPLRVAWGLTDKIVVGYSGNLGRAHEVETLLDAAGRLRHRHDILFLFIGGGYHRAALRAEVRQRQLKNFDFRPYQPREDLRRSLGAVDLHWISLRPELEGMIVPSKLYGIAAAGRPILMVGDSEGEIGRLVTAHECGVAISVGDSNALAAAIARLADDPERRAEMGRHARAMLDVAFPRHRALARWSTLLESAASGSPGHIDIRARL